MSNKIQNLSSVWFRFHSFLVMGGFSMDNLPENYHDSFRQTQLALIETIREYERLSNKPKELEDVK